MTIQQIDRAMQSGAVDAVIYFDKCGAWIKAHIDSLAELHAGFEAETGSEMDFSSFCSRLFNHTPDGRQAAKKHLLPILRANLN